MSETGARALRLLRRSEDLANVRRCLAQTGLEVDLAPLLVALLQAGMIRQVDGWILDPEQITLASRARYLWRRYANWEERLTAPLLQRLPPRWSLPLVRPLRRRLMQRSPGIPPASRLVQRLPGATRHPSSLRVRHTNWLAEQDLLARMLVSARPRALHAWMERAVTLHGTAHLDRAAAQRRGVVVALLHHGPFPLVPAKLLASGYGFHGFHWSDAFAGRDFASVFRPLEEFGWARGEFLGLPDLARVGALLRALSSGGIALVMPDFFGGAGGGLRSSAVTVPVGNARVLVHAWGGWLARRAGATVVPARCIAEGAGKYRVELGPPLDEPKAGEDSAEADARFTARILAGLSAGIVREPEAWTFLSTYCSPTAGTG